MSKAWIRLAGVAVLSFGTLLTGCKDNTGKTADAKDPAKAATPAPATPATQPAAVATGTGNAEAPEANPLFLLPPSKGPAAHQFQQLTLLRSGPSGDLEMQLTGDGIYRIRDHGRGKSYSGDGKLEAPQIAEWAELLKDWESLKDSYLPDPFDKDSDDKIEIIYGGKKVAAPAKGKDNPKSFNAAYKKLLDLNEQSAKEAAAANAAAEPAKTN